MTHSSRINRRWVAGICLVCLVGCGGRSIGPLLARLGDSDPKVRLEAARGMASIRGSSPKLIEALAVASTNADVEVREIAMEALGDKGENNGAALAALEKALDDPEVSVRLKAALAIHRIAPQNTAYRTVLLDSLRAGHGTVFLEIGRMGKDAAWAVPTLVAKLTDRRPSIRALAARTLGEIGAAGAEVDMALRRAQHDQVPAVRNAAEQSLQRLQARTAVGKMDG